MNREQALTLYIVLSRAYRTALEADQRQIRQYGLSVSEFGVLELLFHRGPQPIQQLARKILLASGSMTYVVSQLEKKGLIRRLPSQTDRRVFYVELTQAGHTLIEEIFPGHGDFLHHMMDIFSGEESEHLIGQLKQLGLSIESRHSKKGRKNDERAKRDKNSARAQDS